MWTQAACWVQHYHSTKTSGPQDLKQAKKLKHRQSNNETEQALSAQTTSPGTEEFGRCLSATNMRWYTTTHLWPCWLSKFLWRLSAQETVKNMGYCRGSEDSSKPSGWRLMERYERKTKELWRMKLLLNGQRVQVNTLVFDLIRQLNTSIQQVVHPDDELWEQVSLFTLSQTVESGSYLIWLNENLHAEQPRRVIS